MTETYSSHLICGYEPMEAPVLCILPNNHQGEHAYLPIKEYHERNTDGGEE
jgi:hypothetical protein